MQTLRYGVIGLGFFGEKHAQVAASLPNVQLQALCTRRDKRRKELKRQLDVPDDYADYQELLADPQIDAVSIVTHVDDHLEPTLAALRAGKHVLLEKPMARTVMQCDRMIREAEKSGCLLMVGHICRFNPRYAAVHERVQQGEVGNVVSMFARRNIPAARSRSVLEKIGPILGDAIHDTDLMRWISGTEIESASAVTHSVRKLPNPDVAWTTYRFATGALGVIETAWILPDAAPFRIHEQLEIIGTEGAVYVQGSDLNVMVYGQRGLDSPDTVYWPTLHGEVVGALRNEISYFVDCALSGKQPAVVTLADARAAVAAATAAERSTERGRPVKI